MFASYVMAELMILYPTMVSPARVLIHACWETFVRLGFAKRVKSQSVRMTVFFAME